MIKRQTLVVFGRAPVIGECKTRLISLLGPDGAYAAHVELMTGTLQRLAEVTAGRVLCCSEDSPTAARWAYELGYDFALQRGTDLGGRMADALSQAFVGGSQKVCLVGCDCPPIDRDYVWAAFRALDDADVVFGPAEDGGYGLVAMRELHQSLFENINWGSDDVLQRSVNIAQELGLKVSLLPIIWDVDTPEDWRRFEALR